MSMNIIFPDAYRYTFEGNTVAPKGTKLTDAFPDGIQVNFDPATNTVWYASASMPDNAIYGFGVDTGVWTNGKPAHPWLGKDGLASHMRIMRGEEKLPHMPSACNHCREAFEMQWQILVAAGMHIGLGRRKKNPGRNKMSRKMAEVRGRLRILARYAEEQEAA